MAKKKLTLKQLKGKYIVASKNGILLTDEGYLEYENDCKLNFKEIKDSNLNKNKRSYYAGYVSGIREAQIRYFKSGLFNNKKPDIKLEDWQKEGMKEIMRRFKK